jgi:hypothetical protein
MAVTSSQTSPLRIGTGFGVITKVRDYQDAHRMIAWHRPQRSSFPTNHHGRRHGRRRSASGRRRQARVSISSRSLRERRLSQAIVRGSPRLRVDPDRRRGPRRGEALIEWRCGRGRRHVARRAAWLGRSIFSNSHGEFERDRRRRYLRACGWRGGELCLTTRWRPGCRGVSDVYRTIS